MYHYKCPQINCTSAYIGESGRSLGERGKEYFKASSPVHLHSTTTGHPMDLEQFNIVHKEVNNQSRTIKEAMFICVQDPNLNRNLQKTSSCTYGTTFYLHLPLCSASLPVFQCPPPKPPTGSPLPFPHPLAAYPGGGTYIFPW